MADTKSGGTFLLKKSDFVAVVDADGNELPAVPKHWTSDDLPPGAKKVTGSSSRRSAPTPSSGGGQSGSSGPEQPAGNASTEEWTAFAKAKGATDADLVNEQGEPLTRDELRAKYAVTA